MQFERTNCMRNCDPMERLVQFVMTTYCFLPNPHVPLVLWYSYISDPFSRRKSSHAPFSRMKSTTGVFATKLSYFLKREIPYQNQAWFFFLYCFSWGKGSIQWVWGVFLHYNTSIWWTTTVINDKCMIKYLKYYRFIQQYWIFLLVYQLTLNHVTLCYFNFSWLVVLDKWKRV